MGESTRLSLTTRIEVNQAWIINGGWPQSPFPSDTGAASDDTRRLIATAASEATPVAYLRAVAALCGDRLLVPVVATTTRLGETVGGLTSDKEAEMSLVILQVRTAGGRCWPFTGLDSLQSWQSDARPVPVTIDVARKQRRARS
jgi:hypothetical protein